ncbi:MAG: radical SAM protein [Chloroflexi bacterium]|nr:radical SAM protein [Chloroflexota bacterium]
MRPRPPKVVVDEVERLLAQGVNSFQSCDSEFNSPEWHALEVCQEIVRRGLGERVQWDAMCSPLPFSAELAQWMRRAGCVAVNFGADNGDEEMLRRLKRGFGPQDILNAVQACKQAGITVMIDLLLGAPGETRASILRTMELMKQAEPNKVNAALGLRVYPGTELAAMVLLDPWKEGLIGGEDLTEPVFFIDPQVAPFASGLIDAYVSDAHRRKVEQRRAFERQVLRGLR